MNWLTILKYGAPIVAVVGLVWGAVWYVGHVRAQGIAEGLAACESQVKTNTIVIQKEINRAEDSGPRTPRDASKRLRDGSF